MGVITLSSEFGSGGEEVARIVAEKTGFLLVNRKMIDEDLARFGIQEPPPGSWEKQDTRLLEKYIAALHDYLYDLAIRENLVILGRGAQILFRDFPPSLHVQIISPKVKRIRRVMRRYSLGEKAALRLIREQDKSKKQYIKSVFGENWLNPDLYDMVLNTGKMSFEDAVDVIILAYRLHGEPQEIKSLEETEELPEILSERTADTKGKNGFMHPSEEEFARMLDFYRIKWEYEPKTFLLEWDSEGNIMEAFTPDFYLPEQDVYLELTTQKQKHVWKKNKKIRRLKELYPEVEIKIINNRDFQGLLRKFDINKDGQDKTL